MGRDQSGNRYAHLHDVRRDVKGFKLDDADRFVAAHAARVVTAHAARVVTANTAVSADIDAGTNANAGAYTRAVAAGNSARDRHHNNPARTVGRGVKHIP